nr:pentatricopeptide repeat-containing protein At1g55890, mitochondrial-like [Nicotiana tomentosiformis]
MYKHARKLFDEMPNLKCQRTVYAFNALLEACVRAEKYDTMRELFQELSEELSIERDVVSYNTLIKALCKSGSLDSAVSVMDEMENQGIKPDKVTFNTLLKAYHECKKFSEAEDLWVNEAIELFEEMGKKDIIPNTLSYNTIIKMFVDDRNLEEAKRWYDKMAENEHYPDNATFGMLIHFACDKDDLDFALDLCSTGGDSLVSEPKPSTEQG